MITGVTADSRKVRPGFLFAALPGSKVDGRAFIPEAVAPAPPRCSPPRTRRRPGRPGGHAADPRRAYALAAAAFWGAQPATLRRGHRHQRQDLGRHLLPPDLRPRWAARPPAWARSACASPARRPTSS